MPKRPVVLCVDILPPAMRELMTGQKPEDLDLVFVETPDEQEEGSEKVKDRTRRGGRRARDGQTDKKKLKAGPAPLTVVQDPALGRNIDITS